MLESLWFWISWPRKEKISLYIFMTLLAAAGFYLIIAYFSGGAFVLDWVEESVSKPLRTIYDRFHAGLYEFSIFADNYVIVKSFRSSDIRINLAAAHVFLGVFSLALIFLLALASTASRFYFILFSAFFVVTLIAFKLENILLFGWYGKQTLFVTLAAFLLPAYYFHAFASHISLARRFFVLLGIGVLVTAAFYFFAEAERSFFYLASYGIIPPLLVSIAFILLVGFEVVRGFLYLVTKNASGEGKANFTHFAILSLIYIALLTLIYLYNENYITWKVVFIQAVWLFLAATIIGFWGFREKEQGYANIFSFRRGGAYFYLALAIISCSTYAYFFASANDPLVEVMEDAVVFSQLSFSIIFFVYVLANFFPAMMEGLKVYKIIYKPQFMPFISAVIAALIGVLAFFLLSNKAAYYQTFGGYYISLGNLQLIAGEDILAREYYELSNIYGRQTHYGNFALSKMAAEKGESGEQENYLARSINRNPTEFAFADLAREYEDRSAFFDALFVLKHGINYFPNSGPLAINLGKLLSVTNILDSAAYFYVEGARHKVSEEAGLGNLYSLYALADLKMPKDSLKMLLSEDTPLPVENNLMVTAAQKGYDDLAFSYPVKFDEGISIDQLIYNFNNMLYAPQKVDSGTWKAFRNFYDETNSVAFREELEYAFAMAFAKNNHTIAAMRLFENLNREDAFGYRKYDLLMAQYLMKFGAPLQAADHYRNTFRYYGGNVKAEMGLALMEAGKLREARNLWVNVIETNDSVAGDLAHEMLALIDYSGIKQVLNEIDDVKYNFLRFRNRELSFDEYEGLVLSIENHNLQVAAYLDLLKRFIGEDMEHDAYRIAQKISVGQIKEENLFKEYLKCITLLYVLVEEKTGLQEIIPELEKRTAQLKPYYLLAKAFLFELEGYYDKAESLYEELSVLDAFCEECILKSAGYLESHGREKMRAYNILVEAVEINKYSVPLNKAYVEKAVELGLDSYADDILKKLEQALLPADYEEFARFVRQVRAKNEQEW